MLIVLILLTCTGVDVLICVNTFWAVNVVLMFVSQA